jgi:hypothetical protein
MLVILQFHKQNTVFLPMSILTWLQFRSCPSKDLRSNVFILILSYFDYSCYQVIIRSRDSVVGIATSYGLDDWGVGVRVPVGSRIFSSPNHPSRTALRSTQPPIQWVPGVKRPGREVDHSPPTIAEVKNKVDLYIHSHIRLHGVVLN